MAQQPLLMAAGPATAHVAITAADTDLATPVRGVLINGSGTLIITDLQGTVVTYAAVAVGVVHPICAKRIALASTATGIVGFF
jgi:hypothetical protein